MPKTPEEIWNDIPNDDVTDRAHTETWYSEEEVEDILLSIDD